MVALTITFIFFYFYFCILLFYNNYRISSECHVFDVPVLSFFNCFFFSCVCLFCLIFAYIEVIIPPNRYIFLIYMNRQCA